MTPSEASAVASLGNYSTRQAARIAKLEADMAVLVDSCSPILRILEAAEGHDWLDGAGFTLMHHHKFVASIELKELRELREALTRIQGEYRSGEVGHE